jgi:hypothetical protein
MSDYIILGHSSRTLRDGSITGTIRVRQPGIRRIYKVKFDYNPNSVVGWEQWGAPTEVLCLTAPLVEGICYHNCE